ncbi:MAG: hypothetical protein GY815_12965 [Gammaproteobacteria bacterium]|nr:hypothetical protein [Gammaproteobacteria bacterium]
MADIREGIPDLDTTIDPDQFVSQPGVAVAETYKSGVETLQPPTDIDAAAIGEYTPYEAVTGEVGENATVQGRLSGLLSQDSDYIERARTNAKTTANRRGMLNTSMAAGAAEGAAIDRALPIAQQDAAAFLEMEFRNLGYSNDAARYLAEQSVERENLQAGLEQDTRQFNQTNTQQNQRLNQAAENASNQEFSQAQNLAAANAAAEANRNNFAILSADLDAQLKAIDNEAAMNLEQLAREYAIIENLDTINGSIYQQLVAEIGTIIANSDKVSEATGKVNALILAAGVEFSFSSGTGTSDGGTSATDGTASGLNTISSDDVRPPKPGADYTWDDKDWRWEKINQVDSSNASCCFTGDTMVRMADGSDKQIADVKKGEAVLGMNHEKNIVTDIEVPDLGARSVYSFNDGKPFVTHEHPFMTSNGWKSLSPVETQSEHGMVVKTLAEGDFLETLGRVYTELDQIDVHTFDPETPVYNLLLSGNNTYYAAGFLVHNKYGDDLGGYGGGGTDGGGGGGGYGDGSGCFGKGTQFLMANGTMKCVEDIQVGEMVNGGKVLEVRSGLSDRDWYDFHGVHLTDEHFVFENGEWKYTKDAEASVKIDPEQMFYTLKTSNHRLFSVNDTTFTDDGVFDHAHPVWSTEKDQWDEMLRVLNGDT